MRPTCTIGRNSKLSKEARIFNISNTSSSIDIDSNTIVRGHLLVFPHGGKIRIGSWCYIGEQSRIWSGASVSIGDRVMIAHNVNIFDNDTHPTSDTERHEHFRQISTNGHPRSINLNDQPIVIEDDAWIGAGAIILKGVKIGKRAIIGAGSVVTKDIEPNTLSAGNPAKTIRILD